VHTLGHIPRHQSPVADALVVGVCVHEQDAALSGDHGARLRSGIDTGPTPGTGTGTGTDNTGAAPAVTGSRGDHACDVLCGP
jgi:hypothetical protein